MDLSDVCLVDALHCGDSDTLGRPHKYASLSPQNSIRAYVFQTYRRFPIFIPSEVRDSASWWLRGAIFPLNTGDVWSLHMTLPMNRQLSVTTGTVRWVRGGDDGGETLVLDG